MVFCVKLISCGYSVRSGSMRGTVEGRRERCAKPRATHGENQLLAQVSRVETLDKFFDVLFDGVSGCDCHRGKWLHPIHC